MKKRMPELRFSGFTASWQASQIGKVSKFVASTTNKKDTVAQASTSHPYPLYDGNKCIGYSKSYIFDQDYIALSKDGTVGKLSLKPAFSDVIATIGALQAQKGVDLLLALQRCDLSKYAVGSAVKHIYFKDYQEHSLYIPQKQEQQKISQFFCCHRTTNCCCAAITNAN
ncbi:restriction endonuclease subunit S [Psittacicella hinzii]|uniref:Type I restriction modification DNA specificity domain-containing protein n=1 Tax=Psittacicella hinzii TaxID=2028575 RepID=A0A3A1YQY5_9GAMM|nr:restriction endonuclease subunit S [Psittacicella hinzii]RIY38447.1 hypothetical protein CKF58_04300 [Psittacicella hinzii]